MAFDLHGLICAQMAAAIDYAEDQSVLLDDHEERIKRGSRELDVEIHFQPQPVKGKHYSNLSIRFVTLFECFVYHFDYLTKTVTLKEETQSHPDDPKITITDRLLLLNAAVEASTR